MLAAIHTLDNLKIKGLGPAAANLLYFLHPTWVPPSNTAIVKGFNMLTGANVKLGRWDEYLAMRLGILNLNTRFRSLLSNDYGAICGFLYDIGSGRYPLPNDAENDSIQRWRDDLLKVRAEAASTVKYLSTAAEADHTHTEIQGWLRDLGLALGFTVWIAANDASRAYGAGRLRDGCLGQLPDQLMSSRSADAIRLIDVIWLECAKGEVAAAFEVEHSTSIYSGIVRMLDLALGVESGLARNFFLVAPDERERDVRAQFGRPAFSRVGDLDLRYLPYSELRQHRETIARFGSGLKGITAIARPIVSR